MPAENKKDKTPLQPTSGKAWRRSRLAGELVKLPSGNVARLRRPDLLDMVMSGQVPDSLTPIVEKAFFEAPDEQSREETGRAFVQEAGLAGFNELLRLICQAAFLEPHIMDDPQAEDEISYGDLDFADKMFVFTWAAGEVADLEKFPTEPDGGVEPVHVGEGLRETA